MHFASPAELFGMDGIIVVMVVALVLFGSTQIPKLARSLGSAKREFAAGIHEAPVNESVAVPAATHVTVVAPQNHPTDPTMAPPVSDVAV
jgi:sec-independent protein translocase protein TatA